MPPKTISSKLCLASAILILTAAGVPICASQTETVIYSFSGGNDGSSPQGALVADESGNLYGTTSQGGGNSNCPQGCGIVFQLSPPATKTGAWNETVLYRFAGGNDGAAPASGLIFDSAGNLYGTTGSGGQVNSGTVFQLSRAASDGGTWTETVLYSFAGASDGKIPLAGLSFDSAGNLYGTTVFGGSRNAGIVFQLRPPANKGGAWTESVLHTFGSGIDGIDPEAGVIVDNRGALYGTTISGIIFKLTPPTWTERVLFNFTGGGNNGSWPCALTARQGLLYGLTRLGGSRMNTGSAFVLSPASGSWSETTVYSFTGGSDGGEPCGALIVDPAGNLYGTASGNGLDIPGTVFQLSSPGASGTWTEQTLHVFGGANDGLAPLAGVILGKGGALYGTTSGGGTFGQGTVFKIVR